MKNIENIIKEGIKNGGFTIDAELETIKEKKGFMVSLYGLEKTYNINSDYMETLKKDIIKYQSIISNKKNCYIGLWVDNDIIYLDVSKHYKNRQKAIKSGINNDQLSIYDIEKNNCIDLRINTYILYKYNKINDDLQYVKEFLNIEDLKKAFNVKNIYDYITKDIDHVKSLLKDTYIIYNDKITINEI